MKKMLCGLLIASSVVFSGCRTFDKVYISIYEMINGGQEDEHKVEDKNEN